MALPVSVGVYVLLFTFFPTDLEEVCMQWYQIFRGGKKRLKLSWTFSLLPSEQKRSLSGQKSTFQDQGFQVQIKLSNVV